MTDEKNYVVVTVSGRDHPGITAAFTRILVGHGVEAMDIDQAALHNFLGLSFLLDLSGSSAGKDTVLKDLLFEANRLDMQLSFQPLSEREIPDRRQRNLYVLTFFGDTRVLSEIAGILGEEDVNIEKITNLSRNDTRCIELTIDAKHATNPSQLRERLMAHSHAVGFDLALQKMEVYRKSKRVVFFDMDRTLIDMEVVDEMARAAGMFDEVSRVTERAMRGDIDFEDALRQRVGLLKGLSVDALEAVRHRLRVSEGAIDLVATLKHLGYTLGVVSGGFRFFADHLREKLHLDYSYANHLEIKDSVLTGRLLGEVVDDARKARYVNQIGREMGVSLDQIVAIGDGANDRLMLGQAGLGIAYNAGNGLARSASMTLGHSHLLNVLYILGITPDDIQVAATQPGGMP